MPELEPNLDIDSDSEKIDDELKSVNSNRLWLVDSTVHSYQQRVNNKKQLFQLILGQ